MKKFLIGKPVSFYISLAFIGVFFVGGVGIMLWNTIGPKSTHTAQQQATGQDSTLNAESSKSTAASDESICGLKPNSQEVPTKWPDGVEWKKIHSTQTDYIWYVPTSDKYGGKKKIWPAGHDQTEFNSCYSHDPMGAVFAAMNYFASMQQERTWNDFYKYGADNNGKVPDKTLPEKKIKWYGVQVISYTPEKATIDLAFETDVDSYATMEANFKNDYIFKDGDWRMVMENGEPAGKVQTAAGARALDPKHGWSNFIDNWRKDHIDLENVKIDKESEADPYYK
ncbi:MAG: hypothetical protein LBI63_03205 [Candidatus Ancillula sp.]|jgi:hypothetical protein|nr:hypothetical protein [Candidatus Ancillula sp.]